MTSELILFEGKEVRALEKNGEMWFPLSDLASAWDVDRSTPDHIVNRNPEVFDNLSAIVMDVTYQTTVRCVNERGLYLLMGKITAGRLKNKEARDAIIRFQRWVPELIQKYRKKEIVQASEPAPLIHEELDRARLLAQATGGELREFQKISLRKCGYADYAPALDSPVIVHGEPGVWMNPTDIGRECGLNAREVNSWLYNKDFQYPSGPLWRLTAKGEAYGEEYLFQATSKHQETRIRWHRAVLIASGLQKAENQTALAKV